MFEEKKLEKIISIISFSFIQIFFIFLKYFNLIQISWFTVLSPIIFMFIFGVIAILILIIIESFIKNK